MAYEVDRVEALFKPFADEVAHGGHLTWKPDEKDPPSGLEQTLNLPVHTGRVALHVLGAPEPIDIAWIVHNLEAETAP